MKYLIEFLLDLPASFYNLKLIASKSKLCCKIYNIFLQSSDIIYAIGYVVDDIGKLIISSQSHKSFIILGKYLEYNQIINTKIVESYYYPLFLSLITIILILYINTKNAYFVIVVYFFINIIFLCLYKLYIKYQIKKIIILYFFTNYLDGYMLYSQLLSIISILDYDLFIQMKGIINSNELFHLFFNIEYTARYFHLFQEYEIKFYRQLSTLSNIFSGVVLSITGVLIIYVFTSVTSLYENLWNIYL